MQFKSFILTADWQDTNSGIELVLWVQSDLGPKKIIFDNEKLVFFIPRSASFNPSFHFERISRELKSFDGNAVDAIYLNRYELLKQAKDYCQTNGIRTYEMDIRPTERFLMERFINAQMEILPTITAPSSQTITEKSPVLYNPKIRNCEYIPNFSILSLDIETGVDGTLYSIGLHQRKQQSADCESADRKLVLMLAENSMSTDVSYLEYCLDEKSLLLKFLEVFHSWDPDIIIGWHVVGFDLKFLENKCLAYGLELNLGRSNELARIEQRANGFFARIAGRVVLDGPPLLRASFYSFKNFKLETVAQEVLGVGKDIAESGNDKVNEIELRFKEDKEALAKYNLMDCTLVHDIFEKLDLVRLLVTRVQLSGLLMDRVGGSTAAFDYLMLPRIHRKGYVAPNAIDIEREGPSSGGLVMSPSTGLHTNVAVFDFKSLYPSIIRTFNIDPYSLLKNEINGISTPAGVKFSATESILPKFIETLMQQREFAKRNNLNSLSQAIKILMNSFYGVMGSSRCRFYHADLPHAITKTGHWVLNTGIDFFNNRSMQVLYGDTDSLFVQIGSDISEDDIFKLTQDFNHYLARIIQDEFKVQSYLELEFEKKYDKIFFPDSRQGSGGAKKRYVGINNGQLNFVGMEFIRSDWTELAKKFQYVLFEQLFLNRPLDEVIKETISNLESGILDDQLVITKRLSKDPKEYTKNKPPHVQAALLLNHKGPYRLKEVSYVMTKSGPIPIQLNPSDYDYQYYLEKQLQPIADDLLKYLGQSFDSFLVGDQLSLF